MHNPRTEEEIISSWKEGVNKPVVSVCCITYNHVQHIRKAIESILAQETSFSIEVLLGEDSSFDGTQEIVFEYHKAYPTIIKVFVHDRADVIYVNGSPTGRWNYFDTLENAQGKYIAYIEGDDYWTDPLKLQKQVELMESRPDVSVCGHLVINVDERDELLQSQTCTGVGCPTELSVISAMTSTPIHPNSWLFRKVSLRKHPAYPLLLKLPAGDDPLILVLLGMGKGYCIPEYMSAYRLHSGGTWHTKHVIIKRFSMLQFQLSINELVEKKYWLRWDGILRTMSQLFSLI